MEQNARLTRVQARHDADEENEILKSDTMGDEPEGDYETSHAEEEDPSEPVLSRPPEGQEKEDGNDERHDLGSANVKGRSNHGSTDERGAKVACRKRQPGDTTPHAGCSAFVGVEVNRFHMCAGEDANDSMGKLMKADSQQLEGVDDHLEVGYVP